MNIHYASILESAGVALVIVAGLHRSLRRLVGEIAALRKVAQTELTPNTPEEKAEHGPSVADNLALVASEMDGMTAAFGEHISDGHGGHYYRQPARRHNS